MLLLPPPFSTRYPSVKFSYPILFRHNYHHHHHLVPQLPFPLTTAASTADTTTTSAEIYFSSAKPIEVDENDIVSLQNCRYNFTPLLTYLFKSSTVSIIAVNSDSRSDSDFDSDQPSPTSLHPIEFQMAESYRAVPPPLWHSLLKSLCSFSSSSSIGLAYAVVSWLQRHKLCFSYKLLYSILIHALGRSEKLYEAFLLSQRQTLTPLTYNALIGACTCNNDLEKALSLMSRMRQDGFHSDFVNYSLIIQSLTRTNKIDLPILQKLFAEIESDKIELDGQLLNDIIVLFCESW